MHEMVSALEEATGLEFEKHEEVLAHVCVLTMTPVCSTCMCADDDTCLLTLVASRRHLFILNHGVNVSTSGSSLERARVMCKHLRVYNLGMGLVS